MLIYLEVQSNRLIFKTIKLNQFILPSSIKHIMVIMKFVNIPFVDTWLGQGRIIGIGFECIEELGIINKWLNK